MARTGSFLSGPTGVHNTQKIRKHVLRRGVTRDMNAGAGAIVNSRNPNSFSHARYATGAKAIGPRFGNSAGPRRARFGKGSHSRIMRRR